MNSLIPFYVGINYAFMAYYCKLLNLIDVFFVNKVDL